MEKLCFGCMQMKQSSPVCELCGFDERTDNQSHQLAVGTLLQNQYLVGKVLGQGGFGITYIGWDQHLSIPVAIKEYFPGGVVQRNTRWSTDVMCASGEAPDIFEKHKSKFLKEARTLAQLSGIPEIVQIKSFFPENDTAYIVMEYVQGITLKDHLKKLGRPMTEAEALDVMEPVLNALQKVHDHGLIHRDISPDNIMLPTGGGVKLIDFGTVRYMDDSGKSKSTEAVLKPGFAPMEQYNTRGNLGTWTDVYAICATFHYLLTGKVPADVHDRMDEGESLTILRNKAGISKMLISTLERGMKLRAAERIQTIRELQQQLYPAQKNPPAKKQPKEKKAPPQKKDEPKKTEGSGKKGTVAIACALAAVAIGAAMMLLIPRQQASLSTPETTVAPVQTTAEAAVPTAPETTEAITPESIAYGEAEQLLADGETARAAIAFGKLGDYKDARERSFELWRRISLQKAIDGCDSCTIAIRSDGSVVSTGGGGGKWDDLVALCDGEAILAGSTVPLNGSFSSSEYYGWTNIVAISTGNVHQLGLRNDGTVVASPPMPEYDYGQCNVNDWTDIVSIAAGWGISAGLRSDGTVVAVGHNEFGQCNDVAGWSNIVQLVPFGGDCHVVGLRSDGTVVATHNDIARYVSTWTDIVTVSAGIEHVVGLRSDGTLLTAGWNTQGQCNVSSWTNIVDISAGWWHTVGLRSDGTLVAVGSNEYGQCNVSGWKNILLPSYYADSQKPQSDRTQTDGILMEDWDPTVTNTGDAYRFYPEYGVLGSDIKRNKVKSITFVDTLDDAPADAWDVSGAKDGSVLAWTEKGFPNNHYYDLYIGAQGGVTAPESCAYLFSGYVNLREITFGDAFDTSNTVSMQMMFHNCRSLTQFDAENLDTSHVTDMNGMFLCCEGFTRLDVSSFDTASVTDMSCMFWECRNLIELNVSGFDTSSVTDMSYMFCACSSLPRLDISNFDTGNVVYMSWMFSQCDKLGDLKVGTFDTFRVKDYQSFIFDGKIINGRPWQELFTKS